MLEFNFGHFNGLSFNQTSLKSFNAPKEELIEQGKIDFYEKMQKQKINLQNRTRRIQNLKFRNQTNNDDLAKI